MYDLSGKTALITGARRGIGRAIAVSLAKCGADIIVNYVGNDEKAGQVKNEIEAFGGKFRLAKADLSSDNCANELGNIAESTDILILNASVQFRKKWSDITVDEFEKQVNCNFRSALLLIQQYTPAMLKKQWGRIITIGSVQEAKLHPDMLVYSSTKTALTLMAKSLALQFAGSGVSVNSVAPGVINTDRNFEALQNKDYKKSVLEKIPVNFLGEAEDCTGIIKLLCSEEGRYITGQNIFVDGGMGIK